MKIMRASNRNGYGWVEGRKEGVKNDPENWRRKRWGRGAILKSNNKQQSLGVYWKISGVGIPPPHNSDKPHALVASINNNNIEIYLKNLVKRNTLSEGGM